MGKPSQNTIMCAALWHDNEGITVNPANCRKLTKTRDILPHLINCIITIIIGTTSTEVPILWRVHHGLCVYVCMCVYMWLCVWVDCHQTLNEETLPLPIFIHDDNVVRQCQFASRETAQSFQLLLLLLLHLAKQDGWCSWCSGRLTYINHECS